MNHQPATEDVVHISSTVDPEDRTAACLLEWGTLKALLKPPVVLATARDLMAAAAHAETDIALIDTLRTSVKADMTTIGHLLMDVRAHRPALPGKAALRISAVAGAKTGQPYVHIARGSLKRELDPATAREMALHWTEAAIAAQIDVRLRYALGEWDHLTTADIEPLFELLRKAQR